MPRTEITKRTLYKFDELSDDAKQNAIEKLYDINIDYEWWEFVYEDARQIGLEITEFDIGRGNMIHGEYITDAHDVIDAILENHGEMCETYKTAQRYLDSWNQMQNEIEDFDDDAEQEEFAHEFLYDILEDYLVILRNEYEYLTSDEAIIETIQCNDYEFTEEGELA